LNYSPMLRSINTLERSCLRLNDTLAEAGKPSSRAIRPIFQASHAVSQRRAATAAIA
jgi:hypothetical protein